MSLRIRWQSEADGGAFPLRSRPLHLVLFDGVFDVAPEVGEGTDGVTIEPPDAEGKLALTAHGGLSFTTGSKRFSKVRLPAGGAVAFEADGVTGKLGAEGKPPVHDALVGTRMGGYQILGRLGAGAVGVVYRALQINLDREVAMKMLDAKVAERPDAVASFRGEAQAAGRLSHPNLVQVYDVGETDGRHYYTMELVPGGDLEDRLEEGGPLPWQEAVAAARDCCRALAYAEENGLVHRDVKPENLMIGAGGIKLADLGLAATRGMIDTAQAGGTPHFMAPEAIGAGGADHRSDLYSLGCTLYRLLTGHTVFEGASVRDILRAHRDEAAPTLREAGVDAPRELDDLLAALLAKDPDERPEHASEVADELDAILAPQAGRRAMLVAVPLLLAAAAGAWILFGPQDEPVEPAEPETIYVDRGPDEQELAATRARAAYFEAIAKPVAEGVRRAALEDFLAAWGDSDWAEDARAEIERLDTLGDADENGASDEDEETPEERAAREALEAALAQVRTALSEQRFGAARKLARGGEQAASEAMLTLAATIDEQAERAFTDWEAAHAQALEQGDWPAARSVRERFAAALGAEPPSGWQQRLDTLAGVAEEARATAERAAFRIEREAFLSAADGPVRDAVRAMEMQAAAEAWQAAVDGLEHAGLRELAAGHQELFDRAARARALLAQRVADDELEILEARDDRRADVLGMGPDGLRLRVQISGERIERTDPWALYRHPERLAAVLTALAPESGHEAEIAALYAVHARDALAADFAGLAAQPDGVRAAEVLARLRQWRSFQPHPLQLDPLERTSLDAAEDLCAALLDGDDYLALNRLEDVQARFTLMSVWTSAGDTTWGLRP